MPTIDEVKQAILDTDCARYLREGLYRSVPVFSVIDGKLADVFFMYGRNKNATRYIAPMVTFGIFFEEKREAFSVVNDSVEAKLSSVEGPQVDPLATIAVYQRIESLYPIVRECAFSNCDSEQKKAVRDYCSAIEEVSGPVLWEVYKSVAPEFFNWAEVL